jgi:SAM-dependent methyltransferase
MTSEQTRSGAEDQEFKAAQREMWAMGDYHTFARRMLWGFGRQLVEACAIRPGQRVLDVAAGSGNVAIHAAQLGAEVVASDLTPENFAAGQRAAALHGVRIEWREADAEDLPFADEAFDTVTSAFGAVFAPRHGVVADELLRVCRPGGTIGLTVPALPAGRQTEQLTPDLPSFFGPVSALPWGDEAYVAELFGDRVDSVAVTRHRSELDGFADHAEIRDFLKANHPVAVAMYRDLEDDPMLREDPGAIAMIDDAFLCTVNLWYTRNEATGSFGQEAMLIVARKRS